MIAYYVSGHGYGHAARTCDILSAFCDLHSDIPVQVVSTVPADFFRSRLPSALITYREKAFDVGMVQLDSVRVDVDATYHSVSNLYDLENQLVDHEATLLRADQARLVVSDVAAMPLQAAASAHVPCLAIGNFAWDWIYAPFADVDPRWTRIIHRLQHGYRYANLLLRLPFAEPMSIFQHQLDVPLLAQPSTADRDRVAQLSGADPSKTWVLLSFATLDLSNTALDRLTDSEQFELFCVHPLSWEHSTIHAMDPEDISFGTLLATVDVVLTKPGFGILSECIANETPMIYVDRENFAEYPILQTAVETYLRHVHIPAADLYAGNVHRYVESVLSQPAPKDRLPRGGDKKIAELLSISWHNKSIPSSANLDHPDTLAD